MFLRGVGGATLALPFLPSLLRDAEAAAPSDKFFVGISTSHGGAGYDYMNPDAALLTERANYAGYEIRRGALVPTVSGTRASLSPILTADASKLTPALAAKMNFILGFGGPSGYSHNVGGLFSIPTGLKDALAPSIDQVLANSPEFYSSLGSIRKRSILFGSKSVSFDHAVPGDRSSAIQSIPVTRDSRAVFGEVFVPKTTGAPAPTRTPVVDRVIESYRRLRDGDARLSGADRQRLEAHMQRLSELQRKINTVVDCGSITQPARATDPDMSFQYAPSAEAAFDAFEIFNDVVVAAFACGTSRIAMLSGYDCPFATGYDMDTWHTLVHNAGNDPASQDHVWSSYQRFFERVYMDFVTKLDAVDDGQGGTLLDRSLVVWAQECDGSTHDSYSMPLVVAGSAAGALRTGSFIDYRNMSIRDPNDAVRMRLFSKDRSGGVSEPLHPGLVNNQWLGTALQAMGVSRDSYETEAQGGYGPLVVASNGMYNSSKWPKAVCDVMGEIPPFLRPA